MLFLGLDLGTTNVKALVVDAHGAIAAQGSAPVLRTTTPDGGVEQDLEQIWQATCAAIAEAAGGMPGSKIGALGISSQGGALQLLDSSDEPLGPVISWLDGRGAPFDRQLEEEMGEEWLVAHTGHNLSSMTLGQLLRLGKEAPHLLDRAAGIGFVGDVIVGRLCGRRAHDPTSLSIGMLYNPRRDAADPELLARLGIDGKRLPDLVRATEAAGQLAGPVAERTGLAAGIPVSGAIHDQYAASVGAGAIGEGDVLVGTGTAWVLLATVGRLATPIARRTFVCPHPLGGLYGQLMSLGNGGSALQWALEITGQQHLRGEELDGRLASVRPGSDGLRCWPLLMDSGRNLDGMARGGRFSGITLGHSASHLLRAVVEGLACELARHLGWFAAAGSPVGRLVLSGPAAVSSVVPQIVADLTGRPVTCLGLPDMSAFGAATIARVLAEPNRNPPELAAAVAPAQREVLPGAADTYRELLAEYLAGFQ
ncbi:MAG: xylulokinase [Thermoguttaceae bacterium]